MRFGGAILAVSLAVLVIPLGGAAAQHAPPSENGIPSLVVPEGEATPAEQPPLSRSEQLDQLFATLATAGSTEAARAAEEKIVGLWMESGSDTIDLLMKWALQAIDEENYPLALDLLDRVTTLEPDYVEGWNKRATVYFLTDDYSKSLADIRRVLALEPRHFAALSGLGAILADVGDDKRAIEVYKRALEIDPHLDNVKKALEEIENAGSKI
jgi:tetratricopeptide (TPR) repeat protein